MKKIIFPLIIFLSFSQCKSTKEAEDLNISKVKLDDYSFETTPNDINNVGYIFALDGNKTQIPIIKLNLSPEEGNIVIETKSQIRDVTFGALLKFFGISNFKIPINAGFNNKTKIKTKFKLVNPRISRAYLTTLDSVLSKDKSKIRDALKRQNLDESQLYIIFETIKTNKMTYEFSKDKIGNTQLNAVLSNVATMNDSLKWNNRTDKTLSYELNSPLTVFYKLFRINVLDGIIGNGEIKRGDLVTESELIYSSF